MRRAVSLLEVLISIFCLSIGMMGVAALLPAGGFNIAEANKADRSAACGRASIRDIQIRGMLNRTATAVDDPTATVNLWLQDGNPAFDPATIAPDDVPAAMIDPLVADSPQFPYCDYARFQDGSTVRQMPRLTLRSQPRTDSDLTAAGLPVVMSRAVADRIFTWRDDLVFTRPENDDERPTMLADGTGVRPIKGDYSWMVMVTPSPGDPGLSTVSVVVFYKRKFEPTLTLNDIGPDNPKPSERVAVATFIGSGYAGGDVELSMPEEPSATRLGTGLGDYLSIRENDWLMLTNGTRAAWYRVVTVARELTNDKRLVTLAGPDWMGDKLDLDDNGTASELQAVICEEVVGVYTQVIQGE